MNSNLLQFVAVAVAAVVVALSALIGRSDGQELRPSEHGLEYQQSSSPPPQNGDAQEMLSFFDATTSSASTVQLPEAKNISDTWLNSHPGGGGRARDAGKNHVRLGLLVASAVCGLTGVVLLAISGVVFLFRLRKQGPKMEKISSTSALTSFPTIHAENKISG